MRHEINNILPPQNCSPEVTEHPGVLEISLEAKAEVVQMLGLVRVTTRGEVDRSPVPQNCFFEAAQLPKEPETGSEGVAKVGQTSRFVRVTIRGSDVLGPASSPQPGRAEPT